MYLHFKYFQRNLKIFSCFLGKLFFKMTAYICLFYIIVHLIFVLFIWPLSYKSFNSVSDNFIHYFRHKILLENMFSNNLSYKCTVRSSVPPHAIHYRIWARCSRISYLKTQIKDGDFAFLVIDIYAIHSSA